MAARKMFLKLFSPKIETYRLQRNTGYLPSLHTLWRPIRSYGTKIELKNAYCLCICKGWSLRLKRAALESI